MSLKASKLHCFFCFQMAEATLKDKQVPSFPKELADETCPIFVTWHLNKKLKGCVGTFTPTKLSKVLPQYTLISAFQDSRFAPIKLTDFEGLDVSVSLLVDFITRKDPYDWKVGTHGINMKLKKGGIQYSSTFLPEVAEEQGWDKKETLKNLLYKAGCQLPLKAVEKDIEIETYESSKQNATFKEYQQYLCQKK